MLEDRVILKEDRIFMVSNTHGDVPIGNSVGMGLYRSDTRFLSGFELRLGGMTPILLDHSVDRAYVANFQLVNPTIPDREGGFISQQSLSLRRSRFLQRGLHERVGVKNCNIHRVAFELELRFDVDFLDLFEVRGYVPAEPRELPHELTETGFRFSYSRSGIASRETEIVFDPCPRLEPDRAIFKVDLAPQSTFSFVIDIMPLLGHEGGPEVFAFDDQLDALERNYANWRASCTDLSTDNQLLNRGLLWRGLEDLRILCDDMPSGLFPTAGVPWYAVPFGRDALVTALQTLALNPDLGRGTLRFLAAHQGQRIDAYRDEEPGKILHEMRFGELADLGRIPHTPYYGTVDATPLFLVLLVELVNWTGDLDLLSELSPNLTAALQWIDVHGDPDRDGFIEYGFGEGRMLRNQGWKDSGDSLVDSQGRNAVLPTSLVEVQGYVYHAKRGLGAIFRRLGRLEDADRLESEAQLLARRFNQAFWMPGASFYAQGLDAHKRHIPSISSNPGHALWSGIVEPRRAAAVVERLMAPDMFSGWGIRTLSSQAINYNPMSYHNGTVWPHDNSLIAAGFRKYGFHEPAELVARSLLEAGTRFSDDRLPELFCGFSRDRRFNQGPCEYLVSCSPQAWATGALFHLLQILAGVQVDALSNRLRIDPLDTDLYSRLRVEGMQVGDRKVAFTIDRRKGRPRVTVDRTPAGLTLELPA